MKQFKVWVACTVLGTFSTLDEAIRNASTLIAGFNEEWDEDETPRIYEEDVISALGVNYHNLIAQYDIDGTLKRSF